MRELLLDGAHGIYIPNKFYNNFDFKVWGLDQAEYAELANIDNENYWDAWDDLIAKAVYTDPDGRAWGLEMDDGNLFAWTECGHTEGFECNVCNVCGAIVEFYTNLGSEY